MELSLHRVDLMQTTTTMPGTMAVGTMHSAVPLSCQMAGKASLILAACHQVLPPGAKKTQKVVVGDTSGVVQCFSVKKGEVSLAFKTLPSNQKVTSVTLGRHPKQRDRIFFGAGNTVCTGICHQAKWSQQTCNGASAITCLGHVPRPGS